MSGDVLEARKLVLKGPDGNVQMELEATDNGPTLVMYDGDRKAIIAYVNREWGQYCIDLPREDDEGGVGLWAHDDGRRSVSLSTVDEDGDWRELNLEVDPKDDVPRLRMIGKSYFSDPVLELPEPTEDGRRAAGRREIQTILEDLGMEGKVVRDFLQDVTWEFENMEAQEDSA